MNNKTFWIGLVVVFVVVQGIGFLVHEVLLADTYAGLANVFRAEAEMMDMMWLMMVASGGTLFLFCYIFTKGYEGKGIAEGARYGLYMGLFMSLTGAIDQYVVYPLPSNLAVCWLLAGVISYVVAGSVFATIYKPSSN